MLFFFFLSLKFLRTLGISFSVGRHSTLEAKKKKKEETRMKEEKKKKLMFRNAVPRKEDQTCPESPFEASKKKNGAQISDYGA